MARRRQSEQATRGRTQLYAVPAPWAANRPRPEYPTPLRGRREIAGAVAAAFEGGARLVTLVGTAGVGKTRLADHVATAPPFGALLACFCSLEEARTPAEALAALAAALNVTASAADEDERHVAALGAALRRHGDAIFVLDGLDALGPAAAMVVGTSLAHAPRARVIATCRQPVRLRGEVVVEVPPLSAEDGVALFIDHARLARRDLAALPAAQRAISRIVELVDRIPLAVELAAARTLLLSPTEILERMGERLELLERTPLERGIAVSWGLLDDAERECLAQCAVFRGSFGVDAVERVVVLSSPGPSDAVLDVVARLVDRSLLRRLPSRSGAERTRLATWASVRAFAGRKLDDLGRRGEVEARHERFFVEEGTRCLAALEGPAVAEHRARLLDDQPNLLDVFRRAEGARPETAVRIALAASPVLSSFGPPSLHLGILDAAVAASRTLGPRERARVLAVRGWAQLHRGHARAAELDLAEALGGARQAGDSALEADLLAKLGHLHLRVGRIDAARPVIEEAERVCRSTGQERLLGQVLARAALVQLYSGDPQGADHTFTAALEVHERHDDILWMAISYAGRGAVRMERGATQLAHADFESALRLEERVGDQRVVGVVHVNLGLLLHEAGDLEGAERLLEGGLARLEQVGHRRGEAEALEALGVVSFDRGDVALAERRLVAAQDIYGRMGHSVGACRVHAPLAACAARSGRAGAAEEHLHAAHEGLGQTPDGRRDLSLVAIYEALVAIDRTQAGGEAPGSLLPLECPTAPIAQRIATRIVRRRLEELGLVARAGERAPFRVTLAPGCRWFQRAGRDRVSLARRGGMRLVLERLVALHLEQPGRTVDVYTLFEAAWPGDKASPDVGAARVYESVRMLRKLGLKDVLLHQDGGYLLDPQVEVEIAHSNSTR